MGHITRYLMRTPRGYLRGFTHHHPGTDGWTRFPEEAHQWDDLDECHAACKRYTSNSGELAAVVVSCTPAT